MPELKIKPMFSIGQTVYLKTDDEQFERMIVGIRITPNGLLYEVAYADEEPTLHYVIEILETKRTQ